MAPGTKPANGHPFLADGRKMKRNGGTLTFPYWASGLYLTPWPKVEPFINFMGKSDFFYLAPHT